MIYPVYSIRDNKAGTFDPPVIAANDYVIQRNLAEQIISGNYRIINFAPSDFDLYRIGDFDLDKGVLIPKIPVELVAGCREVVDNYGYKKG